MNGNPNQSFGQGQPFPNQQGQFQGHGSPQGGQFQQAGQFQQGGPQPQQGGPQFSTQAQVSPETQAMLAASEESKRRNVSTGSAIWNQIWRLRGNLRDFYLKKGQSTDLILLTEGSRILAHEVFRKWVQAGGHSFPDVETVRCVYWMLSADGTQYIRNPQGRPCPVCKVLTRDPRFYMVWPVVDLRPAIISGQQYSYMIRLLVCSDSGTLAHIGKSIDAYASQTGGRSTRQFARFSVSRSQGDRTPRIGDSWIFRGYENPANCQPLLNQIPDLEQGWPLMDDESLKQILTTHINLCNTHDTGGRWTYSEDGALEVFGRPMNQAQSSRGTMFQGGSQQGFQQQSQGGFSQNPQQQSQGGFQQSPQGPQSQQGFQPQQRPQTGQNPFGQQPTQQGLSGPGFGQNVDQGQQGFAPQSGFQGPGPGNQSFQGQNQSQQRPAPAHAQGFGPAQPQFGQQAGPSSANMAGPRGTMFQTSQGQQQPQQGQMPQQAPTPTQMQGQPSIEDLEDLNESNAYNPFEQKPL
jgi:hypothetical protein